MLKMKIVSYVRKMIGTRIVIVVKYESVGKFLKCNKFKNEQTNKIKIYV